MLSLMKIENEKNNVNRYRIDDPIPITKPAKGSEDIEQSLSGHCSGPCGDASLLRHRNAANNHSASETEPRSTPSSVDAESVFRMTKTDDEMERESVGKGRRRIREKRGFPITSCKSEHCPILETFIFM